MNDPISWDPYLVKKFSSSNHYKLLNQLKNEVKKYPLNNKRKPSSKQTMDTDQNQINKSDVLQPQNNYLANNSKQYSEENINNSTISFNNAKNFSIYKNNNFSRNNECSLTGKDKLNDVSLSPNFKDRLDQIDMK